MVKPRELSFVFLVAILSRPQRAVILLAAGNDPSRFQPTMDAEPLYSAEQIKVPAVLPDILKQWTKAVIRENPQDVVEFSAQ